MREATSVLPAASSEDPALPHVRTAWDAGEMRALLERGLLAGNRREVDIASCRVLRFRYRPGQRCIAHYEVEVAGRGPARSTTRHWVTGLMYAGGRNARVERELESSRRRWRDRLPALEHLPPSAYLPEIGMHVQVFPFDRHLPDLPLFLAKPPRELLDGLGPAFGDGRWKVGRCEVHAARYRPLQGATLLYDTCARRVGSQTTCRRRFFVKLYRRGEDRAAYRILRSLERAADQGKFRFGVPRLAMRLAGGGVLVIQEAPGTSLERLVLDGDSPAAAAEVAAEALSSLHASDLVAPRTYGREEFLAQARRAAALIAWASPQSGEQLAAVLGRLERARLGNLSRPGHFDLKGDHVLLADGRATIIDFDNLAAGDPMMDAGMMAARLLSLGVTSGVGEERAESAARAFLLRYCSLVPSAWTSTFGACFAHGLLQIALYCVRHQEEQWTRKLAMLLERAAQEPARAEELRL